MPADPQSSRPVRPRLRLSIGAAVVLGLVVLSAAVGFGILRGGGGDPETIAVATTGPEEPGIAAGDIYVHVLGEVARPGLYVLHQGARVADALAAAGGTDEEADLAAVNLARPVSDGEQIFVPAVGADPVEGAPGGSAASGDGRIDLNTADEAQLETLPRIGPALAQRIIAWREDNGRFTSVDDLLAVSGIGEKLLAGLRDLVRV